jgi:hypothetical protein
MKSREVRKSGSPEVGEHYSFARWADRRAIVVMLTGALLMFQPWWRPGLEWGFFILLGGTVAHIVTSHLPRRNA